MQLSRAKESSGRWAVLPAVLLAAIMAAGCTEPGPSARPSGSPAGSGPLASSPAGETLPPARTAPPTLAAWPAGWDASFCTAFAEVVIAQELAVDVERAIAEEEMDDARALAAELRDTATGAGELLGAVPAWPPGQAALGEMTSLMDAGRRAGDQYLRYFANNRRRALNRARELRDEIRDAVPAANEELNLLADEDLTCPGLRLELESP